MKRLLVIEDSPTMARLLSVVWEDHDVQQVTSNFAALLDPQHPAWQGLDWLVTDLDLGVDDVDGYDLLVVARDHHPIVRRAILSGALESPRYHAAQDIAVVFPKPTDIDELRQLVT